MHLMQHIDIIKLKERKTGDNWGTLNLETGMAYSFFGWCVESFISFLRLEVENYS